MSAPVKRLNPRITSEPARNGPRHQRTIGASGRQVAHIDVQDAEPVACGISRGPFYQGGDHAAVEGRQLPRADMRGRRRHAQSVVDRPRTEIVVEGCRRRQRFGTLRPWLVAEAAGRTRGKNRKAIEALLKEFDAPAEQHATASAARDWLLSIGSEPT